MEPANALTAARRRAGLTQRDLADASGVPQSTIGRIETAVIDPRASTLERLLRVCGSELEVMPKLGEGVDRSLIRERLRLSPRRRLEDAVLAARFVERIRGRGARARSKGRR